MMITNSFNILRKILRYALVNFAVIYTQTMRKYKLIANISVRGALIVTTKQVLCEGLHAHFLLFMIEK